ncbi:YxeA family protein [Bacillus cereus]|uniref:YxeA family protein n=1 Tax=Bacillus cereus TaxID=1396 RepID=UPI0039819084
MKRYIALFSILVVFATMLVGCDLNRMGKDTYYVQITTDAKIESGVSKEGNKYKEYNYELQGFDEKGNEKTVEFNGFKELRKEAFLRVYYSDKKGVTAWEEVKKDELPAKVKEKLGVK